MKIIMLSALLFLGSYQGRSAPCKVDLEAVITHVLNHTELTRFTEQYVKRGDVLFFRFGPSPVYTDHELESLRNIVVKIKDGPPLLYDVFQDEKQHPVICIRIMKLTQDTAEVRIGFDVQGAVGVFTLAKGATWTITESDVYQI